MKISFEQLMKMLDRGIIGVVKDPKPHFSFGFRGGSYLGAPGKDIFFALPNMTDAEKSIVAKKLASLYPKKPPSNHVKWAACIRYVYGCFEKQGCQRSGADKKRMEKENTDWSIPMKFMEEVAAEFKTSKNKYGLIIHYEMLAHRIGDRSVIEKDESKLPEMMKCYEKSQTMALRNKCWKHTFTPYYWAAGYLKLMNKKDDAVICYKKALKFMNKYCPDARPGYREKAKASLKYIKKHSSKSDWNSFYKWYKKSNNKCLKKVRI